MGIYHKLLDVCYEECKEQPPPPSPKSGSPTPPKKKMSLSDYKKKRTETNQNDAPKFPKELEMEYERFNEELEKVDVKEKQLDQLPADQEMKDANGGRKCSCTRRNPNSKGDMYPIPKN